MLPPYPYGQPPPFPSVHPHGQICLFHLLLPHSLEGVCLAGFARGQNLDVKDGILKRPLYQVFTNMLQRIVEMSQAMLWHENDRQLSGVGMEEMCTRRLRVKSLSLPFVQELRACMLHVQHRHSPTESHHSHQCQLASQGTTHGSTDTDGTGPWPPVHWSRLRCQFSLSLVFASSVPDQVPALTPSTGQIE